MALGPFLIITHWWWSWSDPLWSKASCQLEWADTALQCKTLTRNLLRGKEIGKISDFPVGWKIFRVVKARLWGTIFRQILLLEALWSKHESVRNMWWQPWNFQRGFLPLRYCLQCLSCIFPNVGEGFFSNVPSVFFPSRVWIQRCPLDEKGG